MKFSALVAIVPEELEQECLDEANRIGGGGVTLLSGRGLGGEPKKTFFGLTFEGSQTVMLMVLEKGLSLSVLKALQKVLNHDGESSRGVVFTLPIEHLGGLDISQLERFEQHLRDTL
ncbi:transcriptional regulator [Halomonas sp. ML-15]|uniref:P-II family nitrogen regulator n=1 Tax=Halomonas sp. ML-15 TaxID=2773305 RepID=UPI001747524B|nr:transcriptional regulator [Halomonas sp. ML-15]MBD3895631.1 transcriptional regulator [Halomonas sp. ML-15]